MTTGPNFEDRAMRIMKVAVFVEPGWIVLDEKPVPGRAGRSSGPHHHDHHLRYRHPHLKGKYPVERGRIVGHEPARVIEELGQGVRGVIFGAIAPCGRCYACLGGHKPQCGADTEEGYPRARGG